MPSSAQLVHSWRAGGRVSVLPAPCSFPVAGAEPPGQIPHGAGGALLTPGRCRRHHWDVTAPAAKAGAVSFLGALGTACITTCVVTASESQPLPKITGTEPHPWQGPPSIHRGRHPNKESRGKSRQQSWREAVARVNLRHESVALFYFSKQASFSVFL